MNEPSGRNATTRVAIEALTLWMESGDEARADAARHIIEQLTDDGQGDSTQLITGLLNLSMVLALMVAKEAGAPDIHRASGDLLRQMALDLAD